MASKKKSGFFDAAGFPKGDAINVPGIKDLNAYALEVTGDGMQPVYRQGDIIIVSPNANIRRGDRVVVRTSAAR
jgi:phage repressor protein C with HTH and peptisase S24 domain